MKAGRLVSGEETMKTSWKKNNIKLLIIAEDLADKKKQSAIEKSKLNNVKYIECGTKVELGIAIGMSPRALIGVTDEKMAAELIKKY